MALRSLHYDIPASRFVNREKSDWCLNYFHRIRCAMQRTCPISFEGKSEHIGEGSEHICSLPQYPRLYNPNECNEVGVNSFRNDIIDRLS